jgi:hypothetical protein
MSTKRQKYFGRRETLYGAIMRIARERHLEAVRRIEEQRCLMKLMFAPIRATRKKKKQKQHSGQLKFNI